MTPLIETVPIGRPISNTRVYILDARMQPVPIGVCGELYLGGDGLAREYLDQPALTAARSVADPFTEEAGARLYRTGDRARYRADGTVEFIGRRDTQVKFRGYRIGLGEIEAALAHHPAVRDAVVLAREDSPGDKRLVGYVVRPRARPPTSCELRVHLRAACPSTWCPPTFVQLDALPLTPNGKVDRKALPAPERSAADEASYVAPRTPTEESWPCLGRGPRRRACGGGGGWRTTSSSWAAIRCWP